MFVNNMSGYCHEGEEGRVSGFLQRSHSILYPSMFSYFFSSADLLQVVDADFVNTCVHGFMCKAKVVGLKVSRV